MGVANHTATDLIAGRSVMTTYDNQGACMPDHPVIIPAWFAKVAGVVSAALVPWIVWATGALIRLDARLEAATVAASRIDTLRAEFNSHVSDPALHLSGLERLNVRIDAVTRRLNTITEDKN